MASTLPPPSLTGPLVDVDWVAARLSDEHVRLIEVDVAPSAYEQGHIPGALLWNIYADLRHPDYTPATTAELSGLIARSGIDSKTTVVFYGYGAHLGYWLLQRHGHGSVLVLDGARDHWLAAGRRWSEETHQPTPAATIVRDGDRHLDTSRDDVLALIDRPECVILDVRSQAEYDGVNFWPSGAPETTGRAGHIPGSIHVAIDAFRSAEGHFRDPDEMREALASAGVTPGQRIVTYCTVGNRAAQAWFALRHLLGYPDVSVYVGSWAEWGFRADAPINQEA
jgi:thiosulfate/3-mercaptopyruvate sulfurtransferase